MSKIKVMHCIHSLIGGGAEKQLSILANEINKTNFEFSIFCINRNGKDNIRKAVNFYISKAIRISSFDYFVNIWMAIKNSEPDIVHVWLPASITIPAMTFGFLQGKKIIFSYRNRMRFQRWIHYPEYLFALFFADQIISNHDVIQSHPAYRFLYRLKNGIIIHNAVSIPDAYFKTTTPSSDTFKFIFIGRLTSQKNPLTLIHALSKIPKHIPWQLDIYGAGELEDAIIKAIHDRGLDSKVYLKGYTDDPYYVMSKADCLLFPSLHEGMPNVLIEAFAIGLPVIASDIMEIRTIVGSNEALIWINPRDIESIYSGIQYYLSLPVDKLEAHVKAGRLIAQHYSLQSMTSQYESLYSRLIQN